MRSCTWRLRGAFGPAVVAAILALAAALPNAQAQKEDDRVRPYAARPTYWEYGGRPVLLIGGSVEDNLFQIPDLAAHLELLKSAGGNYVRNTMSSRDDGNVWPFAQDARGLYDLSRPSAEYWRRLEELLRLAHEREIIVQIEVWDRFDFAREPWKLNPYNPANNVNYTAAQSGLATEYPNHPGRNDNPFFRSVPALGHNTVLLEFQRAQVDRMLAISLRFGNVLYCIDNETNGRPEWGSYWARRIREVAGKQGVEVHTTEMWDAWDLSDPMHAHTFDHPDLYTFVDVSQNNHQKEQTHWDNLQQARERLASQPRPMNSVKIYGADTGPYGTDRDGTERFWRNLVGGLASVRFHRPPSGLGLSTQAQAHIRSARMLADRFDFTRATPDSASSRLLDREPNEAYLTSGDGRVAVYFPDGGSVRLDLRGTVTGLIVRWLDVEQSQWKEPVPIEVSPVPLNPPGNGHWVALVEPAG
jgi:hypothetical protein